MHNFGFLLLIAELNGQNQQQFFHHCCLLLKFEREYYDLLYEMAVVLLLVYHLICYYKTDNTLLQDLAVVHVLIIHSIYGILHNTFSSLTNCLINSSFFCPFLHLWIVNTVANDKKYLFLFRLIFCRLYNANSCIVISGKINCSFKLSYLQPLLLSKNVF